MEIAIEMKFYCLVSATFVRGPRGGNEVEDEVEKRMKWVQTWALEVVEDEKN